MNKPSIFVSNYTPDISEEPYLWCPNCQSWVRERNFVVDVDGDLCCNVCDTLLLSTRVVDEGE